MLRSRALSYLIGVATCWPPVYVLVFFVFVVSMMLGSFRSGTVGGVSSFFVVIFVLQLLTILLTIGLAVLYIVDVFRNPDLATKPDQRTTWVVVLVIVGTFAMPVYWWLYLRPGSDSFARRSGGAPAG